MPPTNQIRTEAMSNFVNPPAEAGMQPYEHLHHQL